MARSNPSFLKRQKEQKRLEKAETKRVSREARRSSPSGGMEELPEPLDEPRRWEDSEDQPPAG